MPTKLRRTPKDKKSKLPKKYVSGLTPKQKEKQIKEIEKSKEVYKKTGMVRTREKVSDTKKHSPHVIKFQRIYGYSVTDLKKVKEEFPHTDVNTIIKKGIGAYASGGSRPNQTPSSWAFARLASVLTAGKALIVDDSLVGDTDKKKILRNAKK
jgi:hypothetical protein